MSSGTELIIYENSRREFSDVLSSEYACVVFVNS